MTVEPDTASLEATDNDAPLEDDNADLAEFAYPEEPDFQEEPETADTGEAEPEEATDEAVEEPEKPVLLKLPDGTEAPLEEVTKGYLRQADYTRKSQELSQKRQAMEADLQRIAGITEAFIDHLSGNIPAMPDIGLAARDPGAYVRQKAVHDAAVAQIESLIKIGEQPKAIKQEMDAKVAAETREREFSQLAERFPTVSTPEGRKRFFEATSEAAMAAGFTLDELRGVSDHRLFVLAQWANEGLKAAKARETAKAKVANAAPVAPRKPGQPALSSRQADAKRKFYRSGSLKDALALDWD